MATTYRFPVAIWQSAGGEFTASLIEFEERAAVGRTVREALDQLRDLLEWRYRQEPWREPPDLQEPELLTIKVPVRPEYRDERTGRRFPLNEPFDLRVPCVLGKQSGGLRLAALPLLGLRLNFGERDDLRALVQHTVQRFLEGLTPQQISRYIAAHNVTLDDVFASVDRPREYARPRQSTDTLRIVADPLGDPAVRALFGRAWERDQEVLDFARRLQADRGNWLLLGEHGCGKTTLLCEAIRRVERELREEEAEDDAPALKPARRFWQTSGGRLIAGMKYLGQWEERFEGVIHELQAIDGVLCVESLLDLIRVGGCEASDSLASFCMPYLQRGELRLIGEATRDELDACRRLLPGFADLFQAVTVPTLDRTQAIRVLNRIAETSRTGIPARPSSVETDGTGRNARPTYAVAHDTAARAVQLFQRFEPYHALPGEVVHFWRELLTRPNETADSVVSDETVTRRFLRRTGLPEVFLRDDRPLSRESLLARLEREVLGQSAACAAAADVVIAFKAGLNDPRRPLGVLLFCGPTGVGKTELAKALARCLFGGEAETAAEPPAAPSGTRLLRLDMSEYSGPWAADRLLLQAGGEPSEFLQQMRRQPFTVVLFDEIEKAHPDIFDVLLNVFDEGRLTDRFGRVTWFRSAVLILTSNLGVEAAGQLGFGDRSGDASRPESAVRDFFRPEFFNRLDSVATFSPLTSAVIQAIAEKELRELASREGLRQHGVQLQWTREVVEHLARAGFDPRYGARPLQRTLETEVVAPLARFLVAAPHRQRAVTIELSPDGQIHIR